MSVFFPMPTIEFVRGQLVQLNFKHHAGQPVIDALRVQRLGQKFNVLSLSNTFPPFAVLTSLPDKGFGYHDVGYVVVSAGLSPNAPVSDMGWPNVGFER